MKRRKNPVRKVFYLVVTLGLLLLLIGGSYFVYAAMTATDKKESDFLIGQVETTFAQDAIQLTDITKNQRVVKKVSVQNTGTINQFIRVMVVPEVRALVAGDTPNKQVLSLVVGTDLTLEGLNDAVWKDGGDGYYYYIKEAVKPNNSTDSLFEAVQLSNSISNHYHNADFSLSLKVETINCNETAYRQAWWQGNTPANGPLKVIDEALKTKIDN